MNLFEQNDFNIMLERIHKFDEKAERQWGVLTHTQMLAHCSKVLEMAITNYKKQIFIGKIIGKYILNKILRNNGETKKNVRSTKKLFVDNPKSFDEEKSHLIQLYKQFNKKGEAFFENKLHPFFGKLKAQQWNILMYKHLQHHLKQFNS